MSETTKLYSVYAHVFPDGRIYIGSTKEKPNSRWRYGRGYKGSAGMTKAIQQYGWENIQHIVIAEDLDRDIAMIMEQELIKKYNTKDPQFGLNVKNGGQYFEEHSDEFLQKLSERMKGNTYCVGRKLRPSHVEALAASNVERKGHINREIKAIVLMSTRGVFPKKQKPGGRMTITVQRWPLYCQALKAKTIRCMENIIQKKPRERSAKQKPGSLFPINR